MNAMLFSAEWTQNAPNVSPQERSTLCDLQIFAGSGNACTWEDLDAGETFNHLTLPAVHLAEGISADWWSIFGSRDRLLSILRHRTGFALPDLRFSFDGVTFHVTAKKITYQNPRLRFIQELFETMPRQEAEQALSDFVQKVIGKLEENGIDNAEVSTCWSRVTQSREDAEEAAFCEAAGALGVDPYSIQEKDASFIEQAEKLFSGEELIEFIAKFRAGRNNQVGRETALETIRNVEAEQPETSRLPELQNAARQIQSVVRQGQGERIWAASYRAARAFREAVGIDDGVTGQSPAAIAEKLGSNNFRQVEYLAGVDAVVSRTNDDVRIHLGRLSGQPAENFAFARAIGSAIMFPDARLSVVNELLGAERQAAGRAFAAEFLAPVEMVMAMHSDGAEINDISGALNVTPTVIGLQMENPPTTATTEGPLPHGHAATIHQREGEISHGRHRTARNSIVYEKLKELARERKLVDYED